MSQKNDLIKGVVILLAITVISAVALAALASITQPIVEERRKAEFNKAVRELFDLRDGEIELKRYGPESLDCNCVYYDGELKGYIANISTTKGYSSDPIEMVVGFNESFKVVEVRILSHRETPGVGAKVMTSDEFLKYLEGKGSELTVEEVKENVPITSGATVTTKAVIDAIREVAEALKDFKSRGVG
jgi:electron transport complex protein RnfG